jgi:hypothetical protein
MFFEFFNAAENRNFLVARFSSKLDSSYTVLLSLYPGGRLDM